MNSYGAHQKKGLENLTSENVGQNYLTEKERLELKDFDYDVEIGEGNNEILI